MLARLRGWWRAWWTWARRAEGYPHTKWRQHSTGFRRQGPGWYYATVTPVIHAGHVSWRWVTYWSADALYQQRDGAAAEFLDAIAAADAALARVADCKQQRQTAVAAAAAALKTRQDGV